MLQQAAEINGSDLLPIAQSAKQTFSQPLKAERLSNCSKTNHKYHDCSITIPNTNNHKNLVFSLPKVHQLPNSIWRTGGPGRAGLAAETHHQKSCSQSSFAGFKCTNIQVRCMKIALIRLIHLQRKNSNT